MSLFKKDSLDKSIEKWEKSYSADKINAVDYDASEEKLILYFFDGYGWEPIIRDIHKDNFIKKINNYIYYIQTKGYEDSFGNPKKFEIKFSLDGSLLDDEIRKLIKDICDKLHELNILTDYEEE